MNTAYVCTLHKQKKYKAEKKTTLFYRKSILSRLKRRRSVIREYSRRRILETNRLGKEFVIIKYSG